VKFLVLIHCYVCMFPQTKNSALALFFFFFFFLVGVGGGVRLAVVLVSVGFD
jgi:hypothetical protein